MRTRLIVLGLLFAAGMFFVLQAPKPLVNPGALLKGHGKIEGDCFECHTPFLGPSDAKCIACHRLEEIGAKKPKFVRFHQRLDKKFCAGCHTDHIGTDVAKAVREFDHSLLEPKWRKVCRECHAKPSDTLHQSVTNACVTCHVPKAWKPSTFDHARYFRFDRHHPAMCTTCHLGGRYDRYTCYECHEHSEAKVRAEHLEEGIRDFEVCTECHRSGDEEEAERRWKAKRRGLPYLRGENDKHENREGRDDD